MNAIHTHSYTHNCLTGIANEVFVYYVSLKCRINLVNICCSISGATEQWRLLLNPTIVLNLQNEELRLEPTRVDRLPTTKEELESLLAEHFERQRQLLAMKATKRQNQDDKLQRMLQRKSDNKVRCLYQNHHTALHSS